MAQDNSNDISKPITLTLLYSEWQNFNGVLVTLSARGLLKFYRLHYKSHLECLCAALSE